MSSGEPACCPNTIHGVYSLVGRKIAKRFGPPIRLSAIIASRQRGHESGISGYPAWASRSLR